MKDLKHEAKRHHDAKLEKYGASEEDRKACGGHIKRAHGGKVEHPHEGKDKKLAGEIKREAEEIERDHEGKRHRDMGGPIANGGGGSKLGRQRGGKGKGKTQVNVMVAPKSGSDAPMPPALGAGPAGPMPPRINPVPQGAPPAGLPPRPGMPGGPMGAKHGGKVETHEKKHEGKRHERHQHGHSGHRH